MPYTTPLASLPSLPAAQGALVDDQGRPTREFFTYLTALNRWITTVQAALKQIAPP